MHYYDGIFSFVNVDEHILLANDDQSTKGFFYLKQEAETPVIIKEDLFGVPACNNPGSFCHVAVTVSVSNDGSSTSFFQNGVNKYSENRPHFAPAPGCYN